MVSWGRLSSDGETILEIDQPEIEGLTLHNYFKNAKYSFIITNSRTGNTGFMKDLALGLRDEDNNDSDSGELAAKTCQFCSKTFEVVNLAKHLQLCSKKLRILVAIHHCQ